jgi:hypothetical protein
MGSMKVEDLQEVGLVDAADVQPIPHDRQAAGGGASVED